MFSQAFSGESGWVRDQGPGVALGLSLFEDDGQAIKEGVAVLIVSEKLPPFDSPGHDVLEKAGASNLGWRGILFF